MENILKQRWIILIAAILVLGFTSSGCLKSKQNWVIYPDGSGKVDLHLEMATNLPIPGLPPSTPENTTKQLKKNASVFEGVIIPPGTEKIEVTGDKGYISFTGYFKDINEVKEKGEPKFEFTKLPSGNFKLKILPKKSASLPQGKGGKQQEMPDINTMPPQQQAMMKAMLEGLEIQISIAMPGLIKEATEIPNFGKTEGNVFDLTVKGNDLFDKDKAAEIKNQEKKELIIISDAPTPEIEAEFKEFQEKLNSVLSGQEIPKKEIEPGKEEGEGKEESPRKEIEPGKEEGEGKEESPRKEIEPGKEEGENKGEESSKVEGENEGESPSEAQERIYIPKRWQLDFRYDTPKSIVVEDPSGVKYKYWYMKYKVINSTGQDRPYFVDIRLVIDKPAEGIEERKVKDVFYEARIPNDIKWYLFNLGSKYEKDLDEKELTNLREEFQKNKVTLSENSSIEVKKEKSEWMINDDDCKGQYLVLKEGRTLKVYEAGNKKRYIDSLMSYHDTDFPVVKEKILKGLKLKEKLTDTEKAVLNVLKQEDAKDVEKIASECELSYDTAMVILNKLTVKGLAVSEEKEGCPTLVKTVKDKAIFTIGTTELSKKVGDNIGEWEITEITENSVVVKKGKSTVSFGPSIPMDLLYTRSYKKLDDTGEYYYVTGADTKGVNTGRTLEEESRPNMPKKVHTFSTWQIKKGETRYGLAIFFNVSEEMDFMAVFVSGLIDPIVNYKGVVYSEDVVLSLGYKKLGAEFSSDPDKLEKLYSDWIVLSTKKVRGQVIK